MKLGDTIYNGNQFKNVILNSTSYKRLILGVNLVWSYFSIAIKSFKTRILADGGTYEAESILEDRLQEITPNLFDAASLVITPNGVKTSKLYSIKPSDGTGDLSVTRATTAIRVNESGVIVDVPANIARIDYSTGQPAILVEPQRTNLVFPSDIATTQVRAVTAQVYTLSFYGSGTVTLSGAFSGTLNGTGANNRVILTFTPTAGNLTLTVNGIVIDWQLEAGSNATSLIPTTTASVTRNGDRILKNGVNNLVGQSEGTIFIEFYPSKLYSTSNFLLYLYNTSVNDSIYIRSTTNPLQINVFINVSTGGVIVSNYNLINGKNKICIVYSKMGTKIYLNGNFINTMNNTNLPNITNLVIMDYDSSRGWGNANVFSFWKTKLTDEQAIQLTTL